MRNKTMRHEETTTTPGPQARTRKLAAALLVASIAAAVGVAATTTRDAQAAAAAPSAKVTGKNFSLDFEAGDCKAGAECTATLKLEALGSFHINDNYPYKLKLGEVSGVELLGKDAAGKNVFSKQAGDFKKDGEKAATLTVHFKPSKAGPVTLAGQYKMSVCSEANCQLETQEVSTTVTVK